MKYNIYISWFEGSLGIGGYRNEGETSNIIRFDVNEQTIQEARLKSNNHQLEC